MDQWVVLITNGGEEQKEQGKSEYEERKRRE